MASFHPSYDFLLLVCVQSMLSITTGRRFHLFKLLVKYSKALGCLFFLSFLVSLRFSSPDVLIHFQDINVAPC